MEVQCGKCKSPVLLSTCLTCASCENHYHDQCVSGDHSHQNWICDDCTSSTSGSLVVHMLQRLQNEITLEREAFERRFGILERHLNTLKAQIENAPQHSQVTQIRSAPMNDVGELAGDDNNNDNRNISESGLQKMFARQVIPSDLPIFTGKPEDWPIFISCYRNSTKACGFTEVENLMRLQRCLRGPARQAVCSKLLLPDCVTQVIDTLELLYGRPELLISSLISQIHEAPAPGNDDLNALIVYGLAVQNLADHMIAAGLDSHLNNPCLLQEMINKLPTHLKLQWAAHKRGCNNVTIATFSEFMSELVRAASQVTSTITLDQNNHRDDHSDDGSEGDEVNRSSSNVSRREKRKQCFVCGECNHRAPNCARMSSMHVAERWEVINELKMCPCCLNRHLPWPCKTVKVCGVNGCQLKHHPMLHSADDTPSTSGCTVDVGTHPPRTLLKYIPITLYGKVKSVETIAFIDEGSSSTLLESNLAEELGIDGAVDKLSLKWIDGSVKTVMSRVTALRISETGSTNRFMLRDVYTVENLDLPVQKVDASLWKADHLKGLTYPPYEKAKPRLLIGLSNAHLVSPSVVRVGTSNELIASKCALGWSVYGSTRTK